MKALERPANPFFDKQASAKPKQRDAYLEWLDREDNNLVGYILGEAQRCGDLKSKGLPFKRPNLKSKFEQRFFEERLTARVALNNNLEALEAALQSGEIDPYEYQEQVCILGA